MKKIKGQILSLYIHFVHLIFNVLLGNDILSSYLRRFALQTMGCQFGSGTSIRGGSYFYGGGLKTGKNCFINRGCYFDFSGKITFEDDVVIGHGVTFVTAHHKIGSASRRASHKVTGQNIHIAQGAWIGANVTILPGISVGAGAIVAAGAVVSRNVEPNTVVGGIPAKVIDTLSFE